MDSPKKKIGGVKEFETLSGIIRKVSIGSDIDKRIVTQLGQQVGKISFTKVSSINFDREFLEKFGKVHIVINVEDGDNERIWKEIVDNVEIEHDLNDLMKKKQEENLLKRPRIVI